MSQTDSRRIIDYQLISGSLSDELNKKVSGFIAKGWQPYGSVGVGSNNYKYQAMVRYEEGAIVLDEDLAEELLHALLDLIGERSWMKDEPRRKQEWQRLQTLKNDAIKVIRGE